MKDNLNDIVIMASEPISDMSPSDVRSCFAGKETEKDLADAFAMASNEFFWVADNIGGLFTDIMKNPATAKGKIDSLKKLGDQLKDYQQ